VIGLIAANVRRRKARTLLTAAGIAVGVAAVVALLALSTGLSNAAAGFVHLGRADLGLFQRDAGDPTSSVLPLSTLPRLRRQPGIAAVTPIQLVIGAVPGQPQAIVLGVDPNGFAAHQLVITSGSGATRGQVLIGDLLAATIHAHPGGRLRIGHRSFGIAGVYHSGLSYEDDGVVTTLSDAQALAGRGSQEVTTFAVKLTPTTTTASAERALKTRFPGLLAISDPGEAVRAGSSTVLITKAVLMMVVLALIIGALAVANTMLAALLERRRELALLSAIGWSVPQLGVLVLGEALLLSMLGTGVGVLLGLLASKLLPPALGLGGFVSPALTAWGFGRAALIGVLIGTFGALYPIWLLTRLRSASALAPA
jgi:putative ABC transport system permease protein